MATKTKETVILWGVVESAEWIGGESRQKVTLVSAPAKVGPQSYEIRGEICRAYRYRCRVHKTEGHLTPEAAIAAFREQQQQLIEDAEETLAEARDLLAQLDAIAEEAAHADQR